MHENYGLRDLIMCSDVMQQVILFAMMQLQTDTVNLFALTLQNMNINMW